MKQAQLPMGIWEKIGIYVVGLFISAIGVALSVKANLGVSSGSALPYVVSQITHQSVGLSVAIYSLLLVLGQRALLGKSFPLRYYAQVLFGCLYGYFVDLGCVLLQWLTLDQYPLRLLSVLVSIFLVALGLCLFVGVDLMPMPVEGMALALSQRFGKPFFQMKMFMDCTAVSLGIVAGLVFLGHVVGIREGTVAAAILVGQTVPHVRRCLPKRLQGSVGG